MDLNPENVLRKIFLEGNMIFKFTESYKCNNKKILTPLGYKEIEYVHKTIPYEKL